MLIRLRNCALDLRQVGRFCRIRSPHSIHIRIKLPAGNILKLSILYLLHQARLRSIHLGKAVLLSLSKTFINGALVLCQNPHPYDESDFTTPLSFRETLTNYDMEYAALHLSVFCIVQWLPSCLFREVCKNLLLRKHIVQHPALSKISFAKRSMPRLVPDSPFQVAISLNIWTVSRLWQMNQHMLHLLECFHCGLAFWWLSALWAPTSSRFLKMFCHSEVDIPFMNVLP